MSALASLALSLALPLVALALALAAIRTVVLPRRAPKQRRRTLAQLGYTSPRIRIVAFFHPYWCADPPSRH